MSEAGLLTVAQSGLWGSQASDTKKNVGIFFAWSERVNQEEN